MSSSEGQQRPNVALAHGKQPVTVDGPINIGVVTVNVPSEAQQRAGWYDENAHVLIQQYPYIYKRALSYKGLAAKTDGGDA